VCVAVFNRLNCVCSRLVLLAVLSVSLILLFTTVLFRRVNMSQTRVAVEFVDMPVFGSLEEMVQFGWNAPG
jgi:hypothetical protein